MSGTREDAGTAAWLSDRFFERLADLGRRRGTPPHVFLAVWCVESRLHPTAVNEKTGARGLNQMMPATLAGLGAPKEFEALSGEEQLPWIEKLIASGEALNGGPFASAARYYHANFFPRTMRRGDSPNALVAAADAADPEERGAYEANRGLDADGDGRITLTDLAAVLRRTEEQFEGAFARLERAMHGRVVAPGATRTRPRAQAAAPWIGLLVMLGVGMTALAARTVRRPA